MVILLTLPDMGAVTVPDMGGIMNPFLWLLFVLAAAVVLTIVAALALGVVKMWRELPQRRTRTGPRPTSGPF